ncbi:MAG: hypothetical protein AB7I39_11720, partial [Arcobacter sp.]
SLVTNFVVWCIIIMLAYKYIYVDMIKSEYRGADKYSFKEQLKNAKGLEVLYSNNKSPIFNWQLKDREIGNYCNGFNFGLIDEFTVTPIMLANKYFDTKDIEISKEKYLGYTVQIGHIKDCKNADYQVIYKDNDILKVSIGLEVNYAERMDIKLHRYADYYKILDEGSENWNNKAIYLNTQNKTIIELNGFRIDIYYPKYFEVINEYGLKYYKTKENMDKNFWFEDYGKHYPYYGFKDKNAFEFFLFLQQETISKDITSKDIIKKYQNAKKEDCLEREKNKENLYPDYKAKIKECEDYATRPITVHF